MFQIYIKHCKQRRGIRYFQLTRARQQVQRQDNNTADDIQCACAINSTRLNSCILTAGHEARVSQCATHGYPPPPQ